jgi:hypothetical protein
LERRYYAYQQATAPVLVTIRELERAKHTQTNTRSHRYVEALRDQQETHEQFRERGNTSPLCKI